jgi:hypothetical protein
MHALGATKESGRNLETDIACFLLLVAGLFFLLEGIIHYDDFFVTSHAGENLTTSFLIFGSFAVALVYLGLAYLSWQSPVSSDLFGFAAIFSGLLSAAYFLIEVVESAGPKFYFSASINYIQFVSGYGSVTILVELLVAFFSYRIFKALSR